MRILYGMRYDVFSRCWIDMNWIFISGSRTIAEVPVIGNDVAIRVVAGGGKRCK